MKAKVFEARGGIVLDSKTPASGEKKPFETAVNQFSALYCSERVCGES